MKKIEDYGIDERELYKTGFFSGDYNQDLYIKKAEVDQKDIPTYFLSACSSKGEVQGYIYFNLDMLKKESKFIGIKVEPQYRNLNMASFLVSSWIDMCLNNGYEMLGMNDRQRKPFFIYMLKKYQFEVPDLSLYETRPDIVAICRSDSFSDKAKYVLFKSPHEEKKFAESKIIRSDNYSIVHPEEPVDIKVGNKLRNLSGENLRIVDRIILPLENFRRNPANYRLVGDEALEKAEELAEETINRHKR